MPTPTNAPSTVSIPSAGTFRIDPATARLAFTSRFMFGLVGAAGTVDVLSGEVVVTGPTSAKVHVVADAASFSTDTPKRDVHVRSKDFLDVETNPHLTFTADDLRREGEEWALHGTLSAAGGEAPLRLRVDELVEDGDGLSIRASGRVDRHAHGVVKSKGFIRRYLPLEITAHATRS